MFSPGNDSSLYIPDSTEGAGISAWLLEALERAPKYFDRNSLGTNLNLFQNMRRYSNLASAGPYRQVAFPHSCAISGKFRLEFLHNLGAFASN